VLMDVVVSLVLHNSDPVKFDAVNEVFSQLLITTTAGAAGIAFGEAIALPGELLQPFTD
jgi:hypothetical protein